MAVYEWKTATYKGITAQQAGEELERISSKCGVITAENVVNESRSSESILHSVFEWDNEVAAEKHREQQARVLIGNIITVQVDDKDNVPIRAFVHVSNSYVPLSKVLTVSEMRNEMLEIARKELKAFQIKYSKLQELCGVIKEIERVLAS